MSTPQLRKKVRFSFEGKNLSLTELRGSVLDGKSFYSVEPHVGGIHNTKLIINLTETDLPEYLEGVSEPTKRVVFYNRLDLEDIVPKDMEISLRDIGTTIRELNRLGYDFTEDDLEFRHGFLAAKATSLGYYGELRDHSYLRDWILLIENSNLRILTEGNRTILIEER